MIIPDGTRSTPEWHAQRGFMLVEALIALVLLTSIAAVIASYHAATSASNYDARMRLQAIAYASDAVEQLVFNREPLTRHEDKIALTWEYQPMHPAQTACPWLDQTCSNAYTIIKVTATWRGAAGINNSLTFYSGAQRSQGNG